MKKQISLITVVVLLLGFNTIHSWAQATGTVKGTVKDYAGKPFEGATVELTSSESGKKYDFKTNNKGEYSSIGVLGGTYDFTLMKDGKVLDQVSKVPVTPGAEPRIVDFDLSKNQPQLSEEQKKQIEEVQKHNEKIKTLNSSLTQARQLESAGNYDEAINVLQQAALVDPKQDLIWFSLGEAQRGAKKYTDAIESYQKAIGLKEASADKSHLGSYHNNLADAYAKSGQTEKAVQEYAAAAAAEPANAATYYFNEGAVFTNTGKTEEAVVAFDNAIKADPTKAAAYYWKGVNLMAKATTKGDKMVAPEGTAQAFNKYLELDPAGQFADPAKQMLAMIGASVETTYGKSKSSTTKKKP